MTRPTFNIEISRAQFDAFSDDEKYQAVQTLLEQMKRYIESTGTGLDRLSAAVDKALKNGVKE